MIRLNLLPNESRGKRASNRWSGKKGSQPARETSSGAVWLALIPAFLVTLGAFGLVYYQDVYQPEQQRKAAQASLDTLKAEVAHLETQYSYLRETSARYEQQARVIDILMPQNRILWSEKLNQISESVPENVYITHVLVNEQVTEIETPESANARAAWAAEPPDKRGPEPARTMVPSITQTLSIEGISYAQQRERRIQLVLDFWTNLVNHQSVGRRGEPRRFIEHFTGPPRIEFNESQDVAGVEVNAFKMVVQTVDLAAMAPPPAQPAAAQGSTPPPNESAQSVPAQPGAARI